MLSVVIFCFPLVRCCLRFIAAIAILVFVEVWCRLLFFLYISLLIIVDVYYCALILFMRPDSF